MNFLKEKIIKTDDINIQFLNNTIESLKNNIKYNKNTRLMMSESTVKEITGKYFYEDRMQKYLDIPIIEDCSLEYGEVIILIEVMSQCSLF